VRSSSLRAALLMCVVCLVGCDHASKIVAAAALRNAAPVVVVPGLLDLHYTENRDVAFDMLSRLSLRLPAWAVTGLAVIATALVVVAWLRRRAGAWSEQIGLALVSAGAIGNATDRLLLGHVIDFIHVRLWPVFNVADALVVAGAGLLMLGVARTASRSDQLRRGI